MPHSLRLKNKILNILDLAPPLKDILCSDEPPASKRTKFQHFLGVRLREPFEEDSSIPPLEWIIARNAIEAFRNIISVRSERIAAFSFLDYLIDLVQREDYRDMPLPSKGFMAELEHLLRGIMGKAGIYKEKFPVFQKHEGRRAAVLRSKDLSRMMRTARIFMDAYPGGLDENVVRQRSINKARILQYFNAADLDWEDWEWHTRNIIRDADTLAALVPLTVEEYQAVKIARQHRIPFGITPYYLSLLDGETGSKNDRAVRAQVIPSLSYVTRMTELREQNEQSMDFMLERDTSPIEGITRRYPGIVILKPVLTCPQICVYCQRNWEISDACQPDAVLGEAAMNKALQWIADTPEISEVLITGGDPLLLSNGKLENLLFRLSQIDHVERIRIGTRMLVTLPQRVTDALVRDISHFHKPGRREVVIVTHFEHPYEVTPQAMDAVQKFRCCGISVYNQQVFTFYNSRKFESVALRKVLRLIGVTPYYTFNTKGKEETADYQVPLVRLLQEQKEEARLMPGTLRTDEVVFNVPGLGKNYLRANQHHDMISILPNGRRVYEFHPWEKKLELADTYVYTDVSIYDYLQRLKAIGENLSDYKTIWYYY
ncbi:MAG: KamA family radical SAM protein [Desulfobacteraceae bacterium]|nr:MAG: KamA family radical SAM protein [Desulfobacteraceae bacterium]